jgi:hypothetical protein
LRRFSSASLRRLLSFVSDNVGERGLGDFAREAGDVACPIAKAGTEAVNGGVINVHPTQNHFRRHVRKRPVARLPRENEVAGP